MLCLWVCCRKKKTFVAEKKNDSYTKKNHGKGPDMPGVSSCADFLRHTLSLQTQSRAPDIISLLAYSEQLLGSLNAQVQAPDDPLSFRAYIEILCPSFHAQDRQCDPYIFVEYFRHCRQEPVRLPIIECKFHTPYLSWDYAWVLTTSASRDKYGVWNLHSIRPEPCRGVLGELC